MVVAQEVVTSLMRDCWLLIIIGVTVTGITVWQWDVILYAVQWECEPLPAQCMRPSPLGDIYLIAVGWIVAPGMAFIGLMGLLGRGPMAYPKHRR